MARKFRIGTAVATMAAAAPLALAAPLTGAGVVATAASVGVVPASHTVVHHTFLTPPTTADCVASTGVACYDPAQFQAAYNLGPLYSAGTTGAGTTIAIVDAFGSPTAKSDLMSFDKAFGLPDPPKFTIIQPAGKVPAWNPHTTPDPVRSNWAAETNLDVQYAHAMAPGANILLVETPVAETEGTVGFPAIVRAENYVIAHHLADVISQSLAATEQTFPSAASIMGLRSAYIAAQKAGITVLGATGDDGATSWANAAATRAYLHPAVSWPATDPLVTAVGGLQYFLNQAGDQTQPPAVWNDTSLLGSLAAGSGGKSVVFPRPAYQNGVQKVVGSARGVPDLSLSAAVNGGALVYYSQDVLGSGLARGLYIIGGTSEATPQFAGVVALAAQQAGHGLGLINPALYKMYAAHDSGIVDVTAGTNTVTFEQNGKMHTVQGWDAVKGYDLATGVGGINGADFVPQLVAAVGGGSTNN